MVSIIISVLVTIGTVLPGTNTTKKDSTTSTSTSTSTPTVKTHGGTSTWTNGGVD